MFAVEAGLLTACIAPQRVWPQRMMLRMPSPRIANSIVAASPDGEPGV